MDRNWYEARMSHIWHNNDTVVCLIFHKSRWGAYVVKKIYLVTHVFVVLYIITRKEGLCYGWRWLINCWVCAPPLTYVNDKTQFILAFVCSICVSIQDCLKSIRAVFVYMSWAQMCPRVTKRCQSPYIWRVFAVLSLAAGVPPDSYCGTPILILFYTLIWPY